MGRVDQLASLQRLGLVELEKMLLRCGNGVVSAGSGCWVFGLGMGRCASSMVLIKSSKASALRPEGVSVDDGTVRPMRWDEVTVLDLFRRDAWACTRWGGRGGFPSRNAEKSGVGVVEREIACRGKSYAADHDIDMTSATCRL
jgi:hypothetical protein